MLQNCSQPNFIHFILRSWSRKWEILERLESVLESDILLLTPTPCWQQERRMMKSREVYTEIIGITRGIKVGHLPLVAAFVGAKIRSEC